MKNPHLDRLLLASGADTRALDAVADSAWKLLPVNGCARRSPARSSALPA